MLLPFSAKSFSWLKFVSVEPSYFLSTVTDTLLEFGNTNLYLQKGCRTGATVEPDLSTPCDDSENGVITVTQINTYILSFELIMVTLSAIFYSLWSDTAGRKRKLFIMMVMVGQMLESALECLHSYWWSLPPVAAAVTSSMVHILCGNRIAMSIFGNMYLADVVDERNRTMRFGIFSTMKILGYVVGDLICGNMMHAFGFFWYYMISCVVASIATICGYYFIQDNSEVSKIMLRSAFKIQPIIDSCKGILRKGNKKQMIVVKLAIVVYTLLLFINQGQYSVLYLYLRYRFNWNEVMYSYFLLYSCLGATFGTFFFSVILSKKLRMHDAKIGIISLIWSALVVINYIFAEENWQLYSISAMDIFFGVSPTVCISFITKFYDSSEMGHLFAVVEIFSILVCFSQPTYNILFKRTLHTKPYSFFILSFGLYLIGVILFGVIYKLSIKNSKKMVAEQQRLIPTKKI